MDYSVSTAAFWKWVGIERSNAVAELCALGAEMVQRRGAVKRAMSAVKRSRNGRKLSLKDVAR